MNREIQNRFHLLMQVIRDTGRRLAALCLISAVAVVFVFIGGSCWFLFHNYERMNRTYYAAMFRDVFLFQQDIIRKDGYKNDVHDAAVAVSRQRGVVNVWFTDRDGRLLYHTDRNFYSEYGARRLPAEFYESIRTVWRFSEGFPAVNTTPIDIKTLRMSMPLYPFGNDEADFIMGMDARRFIFVPENLSYAILIGAGFIVVSVIILFFPLFMILRNKMKQLTTQVRTAAGAVLAAPEAGPGEEVVRPEGVAEPTGEEVVRPEGVAEPAGEEVVRPEGVAEPEEPREEPMAAVTGKPTGEEAEPAGEEAEPAGEEIAKPEETGGKEVAAGTETRPVIGREEFMKIREEVFGKRTIELPFVQASNYVLDSREVGGDYIFHAKSGEGKADVHFYIGYSTPASGESAVPTMTLMIGEELKKLAEDGAPLRTLFNGCNRLCIENKISLDLSVIRFEGDTKKVEYAAGGNGKGLYLKSGNGEVKELLLESPRPGTTEEGGFSESISVAELRFNSEDIFVLIPAKTAGAAPGGTSLEEILRSEILKSRDLSAQTIGMEVVGRFEEAVAGGEALPRAGFVVVKYL